ncbi:MAG: Peptidyl-tRNA hydrolase [Candidatus Uhrbacteria bacterium GW2011_GWE2_46_68]|uniref:Peptidyl-tRNA hydrolase n=1 Tax=Candidatus Uhrbacteria bacterium GW2011_GWE2_46_68 TaxID=1618994 RepID=A0A0G1Q7E5_9BACT|nr:MAG: Peptidyl-tRNA hydrolase [Candidatus Uhrbacteria bacterium GW2011_GWE2_46_68]
MRAPQELSLLNFMKAVIGLGNPGTTYAHTRHNMGFVVLDALAKHWNISFRKKSSLQAEIAEHVIDHEKIILCKPQTFMNVSGYDDADLPFGTLRFKDSGSSAGHNGMQSILDLFPSGTSLARLRVGIGRPTFPDIPLDEWVLKRWTPEEETQLPAILDQAIQVLLNHLSPKTA